MPTGQLSMMGAELATGLAMGLYNDQRQLSQNRKLGLQQLDLNKAMTDFQFRKQLELWEKTGYVQQKRQMKEAGLNPALMYGMGGGGGQTAAATTGTVNQPHAPTGGREMQDMVGMGIQSALLDAQRKVLETQAEKNQAEADKTRGVDTQEATTRIDSLLQGIDNARQQHQLQKLEITLKNIENFEKQASQNDRLDYIEYQTRMALRQMDIVENEAFISNSTYNDKIKIIQQEAIGAVLRNGLLESQTKLTETQRTQINEQIKKWAQEISQGWQSLSIDENKMLIEKFNAEMKVAYPAIWNTAGRVVNDGLDAIHRLIFGKNRPVMGGSPKTK